ncbi:PAS domain S-box-containing protein [Methanococcoides vulcani]|uniref:histidine kinase n=1 Tax=Methanococcoides vulcani TaxID=1353158 RepID=A0A1H9Y2G6_9EURY|nr:PAS domain S-box protein [Methanococcoides vulcani]SES62990.1 PAS domain S-box-containing protein [Methanococcoides vulcani]
MTGHIESVTMHDALNVEENRCDFLIENISDISYILDSEGVIDYISPQIRKYGLDSEKMYDTHFLNYINSSDRENLASGFQKMMTENTSFDTLLRVFDQYGKEHWLENHAEFQSGRNGSPSRIIGIMKDVTEHIAMEKELQRYRDEFDENLVLRNAELTRSREPLEQEIEDLKRTEERIVSLSQFQQTVIENADIWLDVLNRDVEVVIWNNAAETISGYTRDEVVGSTMIWDQLYPDKEYRDEVFSTISRIIEKGSEISDLETTITRKDGEKRVVSWNYKKLLNSKGENIGTIGIGNDITRRKEAEEMQIKHVHFLQELIDAIPAPICYKDKDGGYLGCNKAFENFSGIKKEDITGKITSELQVEDPTGESYYTDRELIETGGSKTYEKEVIYASDQKKHNIMVNKSVFTDIKGNILGVISVILDITDRVRSEMILKEYAEQLEHSNELKEIFTDIMRHDLLNHANVVNGFAYMLLEMEKDEKKIKKLENIEFSNRKLMELIESAASFAKFETIDDIKFESIELAGMLKDVVKHFQYQANQRNVYIELPIHGEYNALANPMIEEVFANLISNAIKYGPDNSKVIVNILDKDRDWMVTVTDYGDGIPDDEKSLVFDRFKRVDKKGVKGTGLGLAIVKRIVDLHGGDLSVEDNPGNRGTVFGVTFRKV